MNIQMSQKTKFYKKIIFCLIVFLLAQIFILIFAHSVVDAVDAYYDVNTEYDYNYDYDYDKNSKLYYTMIKKKGKSECIGVKIKGTSEFSPDEITIPDEINCGGKNYKVYEIGENAFANFGNLKYVKGGKNIEKVGANAFNGCTKLSLVDFFNNHSDLKYIGDYAFKDCKMFDLDEKYRNNINGYFGIDINYIGKGAFQNCTNLNFVNIYSGAPLTRINDSTFEGCTAIRNVKLNNKLNEIGKNAFKGTGGRSYLSTAEWTLPKSVKKIEEDAFANLQGSVKIYYPSTATLNFKVEDEKKNNPKCTWEMYTNKENNTTSQTENTSGARNTSSEGTGVTNTVEPTKTDKKVETNTTGNNGVKSTTPTDSTPPVVTWSIDPYYGWTKEYKLKWRATDSQSNILKWNFVKSTSIDKNAKNLKDCSSLKSKAIECTNTITENGTYYIYAEDANGNVGYNAVTVYGVDNNKPVINSIKVEKNGNNAQIKYSAEDNQSGIKYYKISTNPNGTDGTKKRYIYNGKEAVFSKTGTQTINIPKNGNYYLVLEDAVGNTTISDKIVVNVIDNEKPRIKSLNVTTNTGKTVNNIHYLKQGSILTLKMVVSEPIKDIDSTKIKLSSSDSNVKIEKVKDKEYNMIITKGKNIINNEMKVSIEEGFLTDYAGNKSMSSDIVNKIRIVQDCLAPSVSEKYVDNKVTITIKDASNISKYSWVKLDDDYKEVGNKKVHSNVNKKSCSETITLKNGLIKVEVEDILGNKKEQIIRSKATALVSFVGKEGNKSTYRITTNLKANIYETINKKYSEGNYVIDIIRRDPNDKTGKKFLVDIEDNNQEGKNGVIEFPQGIIYVEDPHSSREPVIKIDMDNTKPTISWGLLPQGKQKEIKLSFYLADTSGLRKYQISRDGKVITTKNINKDKNYAGSKTLIKNGPVTLTVWDLRGNKNESTIEINNIDRTKLKLTLPTYKLNDEGKVEVSITANKPIKATGWNISKDEKTITKIYEENVLTGINVTEKVKVTDEVKNEITVNLKDKIAPRVVGTPQKTNLGDGKTKVTVNFSEKIKSTESLQNEGWSLSEDGLSISKETNEDQEIMVEDLAGNELEEAYEVKLSEVQEVVEKLIYKIERTPSKRTTPATTVTKKIYFRRPIQELKLGSKLKRYIEQGKMQCVLDNEEKSITFTYTGNTDYTDKMVLKENDTYSETLYIVKVSNIVIKGDSNHDGEVNLDDFLPMINNAIGQENEQDPYKKFAMDMNDDGKIDVKDVSRLINLLKKSSN